jgi:hypothetical protein
MQMSKNSSQEIPEFFSAYVLQIFFQCARRAETRLTHYRGIADVQHGLKTPATKSLLRLRASLQNHLLLTVPE